MIVNTTGIVLNYIKYGDTSIIVRVFTEKNGYGSFIVNGIRSKKSRKSIGHFQPFSILELVLYIKESRDLQRISDFKTHRPLTEIHQNFSKSTITLFLTEILTRLLQSEQSSNSFLYEFLEKAILDLDSIRQGIEHFHLQFLLKLASYLGFAIDEYETVFTSVDKLVPHEEGEHAIDKLIQEPFGMELEIGRNARNEVLDLILGYYNHHANLVHPKSLEVLRNVLN